MRKKTTLLAFVFIVILLLFSSKIFALEYKDVKDLIEVEIKKIEENNNTKTKKDVSAVLRYLQDNYVQIKGETREEKWNNAVKAFQENKEGENSQSANIWSFLIVLVTVLQLLFLVLIKNNKLKF